MLKKCLTIVNLLLIAAAVFLCVEAACSIVGYRLDKAVTRGTGVGYFLKKTDTDGPKQKSGSEDTVNYSDYAVIREKNLFNVSKDKPDDKKIKPPELEDLEKTQLDLKLWGTVTGPEGQSCAVIERSQTGEQQLYKKGDSIEQARVKMILRKKVVLSVNGKDEILELEDLVDQSHRSANRSSVEKQGAGRGGKPAETTIDIEREDISAALQDVNNLMRQVRIRPYFENGKPGGIQVSSIRSNSIFKDMGLESGDVIKGINGRQIRSVKDAMRFYENLNSSNRIDLQIQRNGKQREIHYRID